MEGGKLAPQQPGPHGPARAQGVGNHLGLRPFIHLGALHMFPIVSCTQAKPIKLETEEGLPYLTY